MFWVLMSLAALASNLLKDFAFILVVPGFIGLSALTIAFINKMNGVTINNENVFVNRQGKKLDARYPKRFRAILGISVMLDSYIYSISLCKRT